MDFAVFPYHVPEIEHLLRTLRPRLTDEEKYACCGLWAQSFATEDQTPSIKFDDFMTCVETGTLNGHAPYELVHACAWYQQFPVDGPKNKHTQKIGAIYTPTPHCRLQIEAFLYVLLWGDRKRRDLQLAFAIQEFPCTLEHHYERMQPILKWLLRIAMVLPSTEVEPMLINLYASLCTPLIACVRPGSKGLTVYQQYRDLNMESPVASFVEDITRCAQSTAPVILSQLLPKAEGDHSASLVPPPPLLQACAALSIFTVFLSSVCTGDDSLVYDDDSATIAKFKLRTDASVAECSKQFYDRLTLYYSKDVAYLGLMEGALARFTPPAADMPPSPFQIIYETLVMIQHHCRPNKHIIQALSLIDISPDSETSMPLFYCPDDDGDAD